MMDTPEEVVAEMKERFGERDTDGYLVLMRAMRSLVFVWDQYVRSPTDSFEEAIMGQQVELMTQKLRERPDHAAEMVEGLVALILHLRNGGSYEGYFQAVGINPTPEEDS